MRSGVPTSASETVTVVIPSRSRSQLLPRAVRSVLEQRYAGDVECLVVFDGEPGPLPTAEARPGRRLRSIQNARTPGAAGARNTGVAAAASDLVAFCDDDDEWLADKLSAQVAAASARPEASAVSCGIHVIFRGRSMTRVLDQETVTYADLLRSRLAELHTSTILVRREDFLQRIGPFDERIPGSFAEDYEWLLRAALAGPLVAVAQPLVNVYWHEQSYFDGRWSMMARALQYLLGKHPDFHREPHGLSRICGQIAFASAAGGDAPAGRRWGRQSLRHDWRQPRAYLALLVSTGLVPPEALLQVLHRYGRGI
jgi:glycosyltransferase involved in cell wall biosynthesis